MALSYLLVLDKAPGIDGCSGLLDVEGCSLTADSLSNARATELTMYEAKIRTRLCFPHGHCGSSKRLGLYSTASPPSFPVGRGSY